MTPTDRTFNAEEEPLPVAYGGCTCDCHCCPGVTHCTPCCYPDDPHERFEQLLLWPTLEEHPLLEELHHVQDTH